LGTDDVAFLMINENDTNVESRLDGIRYRQQKFICLNDNMNHTNPKAKDTVRLLHQFYMSLFPLPSTFELPDGSYNRFLHLNELQEQYVLC
jgi:UDP-N-acetylglucosamine-lysosomal-enzyme